MTPQLLVWILYQCLTLISYDGSNSPTKTQIFSPKKNKDPVYLTCSVMPADGLAVRGAVLKIWKNIYRSELYCHFRNTFMKNCLASGFQTPHELHWVRQYLVNFTGLVGIVNVIVYKTEPIFTGLGHGRLSLWRKGISRHGIGNSSLSISFQPL